MNVQPIPCGVIGQLRLDYYVTSGGATHEAILGGSALYAAAGAAVWEGVRPYIIAAVAPEFPKSSLRELRDQGIETRFLVPSLEGEPKTFFAYDRDGARHSDRPTKHYLRAGQPLPKSLLAGLESGSASVRGSHPGSLPPLHANRIPVDVDRLRGIHIAASTLTEELILAPRLRELGVDFVSVDPPTAYMTSNHLKEQCTAIHGLDAFIPSQTQCIQLFRPDSYQPWEMAERFLRAGCRIAIIKRGRHGQVMLDAESGDRWIIAAYPTAAVDVTGAGHAFCGGFLAGMLMTGDPLEACLMGNVSASLVIEGSGLEHVLGAMPGLPEARLERLRSSLRSAP